jgi:hypothetical protein
MKANTSSTTIEAETAEAAYCPAAYVNLFSQGLERIVEVSKTSLDLVVEQNTEVLGSCRRALKGSSLPGLFLLDFASQAFEDCVTIQKRLLDLTVEQSSSVLDAAQGYRRNAGTAKSGTAEAKHQTTDREVAAKRSVAEPAPKQAKVVSEAVKQQPRVVKAHIPAAKDSIQPDAGTLIAKEIVPLAAKQREAERDAAKRQSDAKGAHAETVGDLFQLHEDTLLAKEIVDLAVKDTKTENDTVKPQPGVTSKPAPIIQNSAPRAADTLPAKETVETTPKPLDGKGPAVN